MGLMQGSDDRRTREESSELWFQPVMDEPGPEAADGRSPTALRLLIAGLAIGGTVLFVGLIWMLYARGETASAPVLVRAPEGPVKIKPVDRGGMEVPYRDKLVFNRLTGDRAIGEARLRPSAESAILAPEVPRLDPAGAVVADVVGAQGASQARAARGRQRSEETVLGSSEWAIQVAAFRQRRYAVAWLMEATRKHDAVFDGLDSDIVDGMKNMLRYYRVRFGPFLDRSAARAKCAEVRAIGLNCITIAPEAE